MSFKGVSEKNLLFANNEYGPSIIARRVEITQAEPVFHKAMIQL